MLESYLKLGKYGQWLAGSLIALCTLTVGEFYSWSAAALPKIIDRSAGFELTPEESATMVTIIFVGTVVAPIPCGIMMDRIGRRNTMSVGLFVGIVAWLIMAVSSEFVALCISRFLAGFWGGVVFTVSPAFLGEVVDPQIRGTFGALYGLSFYLGGFYESLAAQASYKMLIYISTIPSVVLFLAFFFLPESPYYYLRNGKREEARSAIIWLRGECKEDDLNFIQAKVEEQMAMKGSYIDIFKSKAGRKAFLIVEVMFICQRLSGMTFLFAYITVIVPDLDEGSWASAQNSFTVLSLSCILFSTITTFIMDSFGRKTFLVVSCAGCALSQGGNTVWYYLRDKTPVDTSSTNWLPLTLLVVTGMFYAMGMVSIPALLQAELYPVNLKSQGAALACITANFVSGLGTQFFYIINSNIGMYFNFLVMTISPIVWLVFTIFFVVETRGKSLETIQDMLNGRRSSCAGAGKVITEK